MYVYWYEDGQLKSYEGTKTGFIKYMDINSYYIYGEFKSMPNSWFKTVVTNGTNSICNIIAEDVPSDIRAMHLLLVKE